MKKKVLIFLLPVFIFIIMAIFSVYYKVPVFLTLGGVKNDNFVTATKEDGFSDIKQSTRILLIDSINDIREEGTIVSMNDSKIVVTSPSIKNMSPLIVLKITITETSIIESIMKEILK